MHTIKCYNLRRFGLGAAGNIACCGLVLAGRANAVFDFKYYIVFVIHINLIIHHKMVLFGAQINYTIFFF